MGGSGVLPANEIPGGSERILDLQRAAARQEPAEPVHGPEAHATSEQIASLVLHLASEAKAQATAGAGPVAAAVGVVASRDFRARELLQAEWREEIRHLSPVRRLRWLFSASAEIAFGPAQAKQLRKQVIKQIERVRRAVPGGWWASEAFEHRARDREEVLPIFCGDDGKPLADPGTKRAVPRVRVNGLELPGACVNRRHASRMVLSRVAISYGNASYDAATETWGRDEARRRWTSPIAVGEEDFVDGQDELDALRYPHPTSISAHRIRLIGIYKMKPVDGKW